MDGPTHRYLDSSPGCWHLFGTVLAREYSDLEFGALHRLTVDSYAVQHPGRPSPQTIQSVCLHLISLCLILESEAEPEYATRVMQAGARAKERFFWLPPPASLGSITVADVAGASTPDQHTRRIQAWAEDAWSAWAKHHDIVQGWLHGLTASAR